MSIQSEIDRIRGNVNASLRAVAVKGVDVQESDGSNELPSLIASIPTPDVSGQIAAHNTNTEAHNDIRELITGLTNRMNALADSNDTTLDQLSEVVAYIKSNRSLIESITTSKVNVDDIINNLTTNVSNKPLSAAQGVVLKALIDAITVPTKVSELENDSGYLTSYTETDPTVPAWAKAETKPTYTANEVGARPNTWTPSASDVGAIPVSEKGTAGGVATLGADGKVPTTQLPSMNYAPSTHASQHGSSGSDPITPAAIGAAASSHNQAASTITAGTFAATGVKAATGTDYTTARLRNIQASTTDLTAGSSALANGDIYLVYE